MDICGWTDAAIGSVSSVFPSLASNGQSCSISDNSSLTLGQPSLFHMILTLHVVGD